jgi:hypothetical protein
MSIPAAWPQVLDFFGTPMVIKPWLARAAVNARRPGYWASPGKRCARNSANRDSSACA